MRTADGRGRTGNMRAAFICYAGMCMISKRHLDQGCKHPISESYGRVEKLENNAEGDIVLRQSKSAE